MRPIVNFMLAMLAFNTMKTFSGGYTGYDEL